MTEKLKVKDAKTFLFRSWHDLRISALFLGLALIVQLVTPPEMFAQEAVKHKVMGKVTAASDGNAIPGVNIKVKGSTIGTVTDMGGNFSLDLGENDALIFSFIGYVTEEIFVAGRTNIDVKLVEDIAKLDEIVVIGYGTKKRKDVTGSISSITSEDIMQSKPVTIEQALQGKIAGVVVQQISGQPGGGVSVQIRGLTSFTSSNPLYVIDGIQIEVGGASEGVNPLAALNPSEIESMDVLKDASATAIYGAKGTDGVIIITTKRGKLSAPKITYAFETGYQQIAKKVDVMNLQEYATFTNERSTGIGWDWDARPVFANPKYLGKGTDWQDALFRNAPLYSHTLSVSGGDARTTYYLSGAYYKQEGIARSSEFDRISVRLNLDNKTTNWLKIGTSLQLASMYDNKAGSTGVIQQALNQTPDVAVKNADGTWAGRYNPNGWINNTPNPVAMASINKNDLNRKEIYGTLYAEVTFARGLVLRNEASGIFRLANQESFNPNYKTGLVENLNNSGSYSSSTDVQTTINNVLTYNHLFINRYNLTAQLGHEAILDKGESISGSRSHYASNNVQVIDQGDPTSAKNGGSKRQGAREGYFGRFDLGINDKYLLTGTIREDGDSKYFVDNRWILSYSGVFAWKLSSESFMKSISAINDVKLRLSYGLTNKNAGRAYAYASTFSTVATGLTGIAQELKNIGNPGLKWEQTKTANIGLDAAFLNSRVSFSVDFYDRKTDNLAMQTSLPWYSGTAIGWSPGALDAPWINVGSMENKGFDFTLHTTNIKGSDFTWRTDFTVSRNFNKVLKLNADGAPIIGYPVSKTVVGRSLGEFYGYVVDGVYANPIDFLGDAEKGIQPVARPVNSDGNMYPVGTASGSIWYGDIKFRDLNKDGVIDSKDQTFLGSPIPKVQLGFNNTFSYKNFDLNIFFTSNYGNKVFNRMRVEGENTRNSVGNLKVIMNYAKLGLIDPEGSATDVNNVYVLNPDTKIQGLRNDDTNGNNRTSDRYVEDGSFIKCKNISLGYNVPQSLIQRLHINSLRVYANVSNVFTITKYTGLDPEIGSWDPLSAGVDYGYYPQPRVFTFGLNISLN